MMNPIDVIESYVLDVMRRVPAKERNEIGLELRGLLTEMFTERAPAVGQGGDDRVVLAMLREFGTPAEVAARYQPPGMVIIPATQTRSFALVSLIGVGLQWALSFPRVLEGQPLSSWWFSWGLGSFWWPGFLVLFAMLGAALRRAGWFEPVWKPRLIDPDRINRGVTAFGLVWFAIGALFMVGLPWIVGALPEPLAHVFAFDTAFLHHRAWPVIVLWAGGFANMALVLLRGRWSSQARHLAMAFNLAWVALFVWWVLAGTIFQAKASDDGVKGALVLMVLILLVDTASKLYRERARIRVPELVG